MSDRIDKESIPTISYTRSQGVEDRVLLRAHVTLIDGPAAWRRGTEDRSITSLAAASEEDQSAALMTAVSTGLGDAILDQACSHWSKWQKQNPRSKLIIVATSIAESRRISRRLSRSGFPHAIANSDESAEAHANIERFRNTESLNCLVTVGMASEGLDAPACDHLACLTRIRSAPYLEQVFARTTRFDRHGPAYEDQCAFIFAPQDQKLREALEVFGTEQFTVTEYAAEEVSHAGSSRMHSDVVIPISSGAADSVSVDLDSHRMIESVQIEEAIKSAGVTISPEQADVISDSLRDTRPNVVVSLPVTPAQALKATRRRIEAIVRERAPLVGLSPKDLNAKIKEAFRKSRNDMSLEELDRVIQWLERWSDEHLL